METKYLRIYTFIFWKKNQFFFIKKQKKHKNYNFKDTIAILKIISLMGYKVYEISLKEYSYHFLL